MEIQKRGGTNIIPNHALNNVGNPNEACLPSSRPGLTSYALEIRAALRMIRVFVFLNDLMPEVGVGAAIYREYGLEGKELLRHRSVSSP